MKIGVGYGHVHNLQEDLQRLGDLQARRRMLRWLLAGSAASLLSACHGGRGSRIASSAGSSAPLVGTRNCDALPEETAGPYPSDGSNQIDGVASNVLLESGIVRSDIRSSFGSSSSVAPGVPLTLALRLVNTNDRCAPLVGYAVYLWHCTRDGGYSLYAPALQEENFLRGVQVSDASGVATFRTIVPGCYPGRYPHMHFEVYASLAVATLYANQALTSQIALPRDVVGAVYTGVAGYGSSARRLSRITVSNDSEFRDNSAEQITAMTPAMSGSIAAGFVGNLVLGVAA